MQTILIDIVGPFDSLKFMDSFEKALARSEKAYRSHKEAAHEASIAHTRSAAENAEHESERFLKIAKEEERLALKLRTIEEAEELAREQAKRDREEEEEAAEHMRISASIKDFEEDAYSTGRRRREEEQQDEIALGFYWLMNEVESDNDIISMRVN